MRKTLTTLTAALALTVAPFAVATATSDTDRPRYRQVSIPTKPCKFEDGPGPCFWDAGKRGNGRGHSFWITRKGRVVYLDPRVNR